MNIVLVSTYDTPCGVATYTRNLAHALATLGHQVFVCAERTDRLTTAVESDGPVRWLRSWVRATPYESPFGLGALARSIAAGAPKPDVVHVQHEHGIFPRTPDVLRFARDVGVPVAFTLHTVDEDHIIGLRALATVGRAIVHTPEAKALLWDYPTAVVPHGIATPDTPRQLGDYLLVPGFVSANKNVVEIIAAYAHTLVRYALYPYPLRIAGLCRDTEYAHKIWQAIGRRELGDQVTFENAYQDDEAAAKTLRGAAAVILGAGDTTPYSASGQLHDAVGAGVPVLAKNVPIYQHPAGAGVLYYRDAAQLSTWMAALQDPALREHLEARQALAFLGLSWAEVARKTLKVYGG